MNGARTTMDGLVAARSALATIIGMGSMDYVLGGVRDYRDVRWGLVRSTVYYEVDGCVRWAYDPEAERVVDRDGLTFVLAWDQVEGQSVSVFDNDKRDDAAVIP